MRAYLYTRFSPRPDEGETESIETQVELCHAFARKRGLVIQGEPFVDRAMSGADPNRPGLWAAMNAVGKGDTLIVYKWDRLARSPYLWYDLRRHLQKIGAHVLSASGEPSYEGTDEDRLVWGILAHLDEYNRVKQNARTQAAMLRHQVNGRRMSSAVLTPYGWTPDPENPRRLVRNEAEQATIQRIVELRRKGHGLRRICQTLEADGIQFRPGTPIVRRTGNYRTAGKWYPKQVARILTREGG